MRVLYIAGPYRAPNAWLIEQNIRCAEALALLVWTRGFVAICPHTLSRFYQGVLPDATWLAGDLELVSRCDGVLLVPGWGQSQGAQAEREFALRCGIPVFTTVGEAERLWAGDKAEEAGNVPAPSGVG